MMNMYWDGIDFEIPKFDGLEWYRVVDTSLPSPNDIARGPDQMVKVRSDRYTLTGRSVVVLFFSRGSLTLQHPTEHHSHICRSTTVASNDFINQHKFSFL